MTHPVPAPSSTMEASETKSIERSSRLIRNLELGTIEPEVLISLDNLLKHGNLAELLGSLKSAPRL